MFNFNKKDTVEDELYPVRALRYKETKFRPRPFYIYVGQTFDVDGKRNAISVTRIEFRKDYYDASGDMFYDVYVKTEDGLETKWKRLSHEDNLDVEFMIDFS